MKTTLELVEKLIDDKRINIQYVKTIKEYVIEENSLKMLSIYDDWSFDNYGDSKEQYCISGKVKEDQSCYITFLAEMREDVDNKTSDYIPALLMGKIIDFREMVNKLCQKKTWICGILRSTVENNQDEKIRYDAVSQIEDMGNFIKLKPNSYYPFPIYEYQVDYIKDIGIVLPVFSTVESAINIYFKNETIVQIRYTE